MSGSGDGNQRTRKPLEDIPVLTEVVDLAHAAGLSRAQIDALVAQIERAVIEEIVPRLEDAVHQAVRAAVEHALAEPREEPKKR